VGVRVSVLLGVLVGVSVEVEGGPLVGVLANVAVLVGVAVELGVGVVLGVLVGVAQLPGVVFHQSRLTLHEDAPMFTLPLVMPPIG
jgi:hypothetical protein